MVPILTHHKINVDVVIEFGHNDGGMPSTSDRAPVGGESLNATQTVTLFNGTIEVVHTFSWSVIGFDTHFDGG